MRWNRSQPAYGATRERRAFLWWPKTIGGETRWLETTQWEEKCYPYDSRLTGERMGHSWETTRWLEDHEGVHEMAKVKVNDVFKDTVGRLWHVTEIQDGMVTLACPYGLKGDRDVPVEFVPQLFSFCWNAVEEGWAGI